MKKWKNSLIVALVLGMSVGLAQAGVVTFPGRSVTSDYGQASFDNRFDSTTGTYSGDAQGSVSGGFVITHLDVSFSWSGNRNPTPNNLGTFYMSLNGDGYVPEDPANDPFVQAHLNDSPSAGGSRSVYEARIETGSDDKGGTYDYVAFEKQLGLNIWSWSSPWLNTETGEFSNYLTANFSVENGIFTDVYPYLQTNVWSDPNNPPPDWFDEVSFGFSASGIITGENFAIVTVPEPATMTMMGIGALALAHRVWRRKDIPVTRIG
ncbi:MAG: PEP-CTERM sorting domain-containing protein [Patescibacteria group bacterium]|mgnify:CR=1 FL=1